MKNQTCFRSFFRLFSLVAFTAIVVSCEKKEAFYSAADFDKVPKTDVHFHYNTPDPYYIELAAQLNFRLVSPNVDSGNSLDEQLNNAVTIRNAYPDRFAFFGTFSVDSFGKPGFTESVIARIDSCMSVGAAGIKIWKNIGMVLKDDSGKYVMVDDARLDPIFRHLAEKNITVMGHLGEPKNCWQPLEEMNDSNNYRYYKSHPQYHMHMFPEAPSYDDQINARDNLLARNPDLDFVASHLASLEWSVDELALRMERFPDLDVEMSARINHLQYQSIQDYEKVRQFLLKYQDRLMYGTDVGVTVRDTNYESRARNLEQRWRSHWIYLATDSVQIIRDLPGDVKGLHLPKEVIDKIYQTNADRLFNKPSL